MANHTTGGNNTTPSDSGGNDGTLEHFYLWLTDSDQSLLLRLIFTVLLFAGATVLAKIAKRSLELSANRTAIRNHLDPWKTRALLSRTKPLSIVIHITLYTTAFIAALYLWGLRTAFVSTLTAAGFAGIVIGMAAANSLANLIAGFLIFYNHPFDIGDWVEIDTIEGIVVDVKAGATVLETWDGEKVTFPNRLVEGTRVRNFSHQRKLRRRFQVSVDYSTDISRAREILLTTIKGHPDVLKEPEPQVVALSFGDSGIGLEVRFWIAPLRAQALLIQTWFMQEVQRAFAREGIVIPFPQRTLTYRFTDGNPPPNETLSRLTYDPAADTRPVPGPPILPPHDTSSTHHKQTKPPFWWFQKQERGKKGAADSPPAEAPPKS